MTKGKTTGKTWATPKPGSIIDRWNRGVARGTAKGNYPCYAVCDNCDRTIRCADSTADWCHVTDYRGMCSILRTNATENN